ncbi:isoform 1 [Micractinium conductrix]|uniref:Isoform 1 n=1 Tax=Micractinium conductrix TaxID=554055 RepID=A0A2P6VKV2_9CHLO|nr:isoform 1 [Micractinium conductrix]|eukprot:PSC74690.1 isoform 1 [Micractinium conductrix]
MSAPASCSALWASSRPVRATQPALQQPGAAQAGRRDRLAVARAGKQQDAAVVEPPAATPTPQQQHQGDPASLAASRRYLSLLPPFLGRATDLEELSPGRLWALTQPLKLDWQAFDIRLRMVVARLPDGNMLVVSPIAPTQEALAQLAQLGGAVRHVVLPSSSPEHWFYGPALCAAFPDAAVWAVPGLLEGKGLPFPFFQQYMGGVKPRCRVLGVDPLPAELQGQIETEVLTAPFFIEAAVILPQHGALLLADTGFCMSAAEYGHLGAGNIKAAKKVGVWDRLGPITKVVFDKCPEQGRAWVDAILARQTWDTVVPAHATAPIRDGRAAFKACFDFLYQ